MIIIYVFRTLSLPMYKMQDKVFFQMIYDGFLQEDRFELLFFIIYFIKRLFFAVVLVFLSNINNIGLNCYIFVVALVPLLYFSYAVPFKSKAINAMLCLNEFSEFFVGVILLHY